MENKNEWSRRKFSKAVLSLQALITTGALGINIGCGSKEKKSEGELLDHTSKERLRLAMDEIIPASGKMPAASEVGTMEYILKVLDGYPDLLEGFNDLLSRLNETSINTANNDFESLDSTSRILVLKKFEKDEPKMFAVLRDFVYEGYYINEKVWKLIGYEPYPTMAAGPEMDPFDEAMLDRVRKMTSFYLNV